MKCKLCNKETGLFYCLDCGKVIEYPDFIKGNPKLERGLDEIIVNLSFVSGGESIKTIYLTISYQNGHHPG